MDDETIKNLEYYADYFEAVLWANEIDNLSIYDIDTDSALKQIKEIDNFFGLIESIDYGPDYSFKQLQHDFYFTRDNHGVGFWEYDHCNKEQGDKLTKITNDNFKELYVYVENDKIYIE